MDSPAAFCWHALSNGCVSMETMPIVAPPHVPRELDKRPLPQYVVEPPDVLHIDALRLVPKSEYRIASQDTLYLRVANTFADEPIDGPYTVEADGTIDLGGPQFSPKVKVQELWLRSLGIQVFLQGPYGGKLSVADRTLAEAKELIEKRLREYVRSPRVFISATPSQAFQQVRGPHLVRPDGTVGLGKYGSVPVAGLTIEEVKQAIEAKLELDFLKPEVSVDVAAFNSKLFYVILDNAGSGEQVVRFPITGSETVLDAIAQVNGLLPASNKREIYLARPTPSDSMEDEVLPVDWVGLCTRGRTATNYQLRPGDRVYINSEHIVEFDTRLARLLSPLERLLGVTLLGNAVIRNVNGTNTGTFVGTGF